ncbi:DUF4232 domain-containing protein [Streptomyces botrytidirepellens]|uniref:DUF4232 domain-containing protein n=1 Tax=Streptomyces botrytidirepellens TaxID=2486417 RepID=A0A3M8WYL0_9ACTN|nr:DUF4232 domain-containing protein [Streptomyces botrytidirepellens]RNG34229.1 DUF4232 domain-containing protein [Streptomyces botrytidirepellens]
MSRTTALRRTRTVVAASLVAAAAFSLTACGGGESGNDAKGSSSSAAKQSASGEDVDAKAGSASGGSSSKSRCAAGQLEAAWSDFEGGPDMDYEGQQTARVVLTNTGSSDCTMTGFPGVQLRAAHGDTWDLRRNNDKPKAVRIEAGGKAGFDITFLASTRDDDQKFAPERVVITPPDEERNISLEWPYGGALLDQSGATRPGTFVGPVNTVE